MTLGKSALYMHCLCLQRDRALQVLNIMMGLSSSLRGMGYTKKGYISCFDIDDDIGAFFSFITEVKGFLVLKNSGHNGLLSQTMISF